MKGLISAYKHCGA